VEHFSIQISGLTSQSKAVFAQLLMFLMASVLYLGNLYLPANRSMPQCPMKKAIAHGI
jgi:hypothetical protein